MRRFSARMKNRRAGGERHPFAFFAAAALILLAAVFVIGMQAGRLVERRMPGGAAARSARPSGIRTASPGEVDKALDAFAEEAARIPSARPQSAGEDLAATEKSITFRRTLVGEEPETVPLRPAAAAPGRAQKAGATLKSPGRKYIVQAGAFTERGTAEALRDKLARKGIPASVSKANGQGGKTLYRVVVGPFADRAEARKTIVRLRADVKTKAILITG